MRDCLVVCFIVTGLATFMNAETRSSAESDTPCSLLGILCISLALVIDAANINMQVRRLALACVWDGESARAESGPGSGRPW